MFFAELLTTTCVVIWFTLQSVHSEGELLFEESDPLGGKSRTVEPSHKQNEESTSRSGGGFMDEYSDALQHELQRTSLGKSFASSSEEKDEPAKVFVILIHLIGFTSLDSLTGFQINQDSCMFGHNEIEYM